MSRRRGPVETPEYAAMVRRMIRSYGRRVGEADPEDLAELVAMRQVLDDAIQEAVDGLRRRRSWRDIGLALGLTKQAAQQRYGFKFKDLSRMFSIHNADPLPGCEVEQIAR